MACAQWRLKLSICFPCFPYWSFRRRYVLDTPNLITMLYDDLRRGIDANTPPYPAPDGESVGGKIFITAASSRSEEHTSELQSLMRISYAVFCLKKKTTYKS